MFRKMTIAIMLGASLMLTACSGQTQTKSHVNAPPKMTATQVILKTSQRTKKIENMQMKSAMTIDVAVNGQKSVQNSISNTLYDLKQPLMYQTSTISIKENSQNKKLKTESYLNPSAMYSKSDVTPEWTKVPVKGKTGQLLKDALTKNNNPSGQLIVLKEFKKNIKLKTNANNYVVQFQGNEKETAQLLKKSMSKSLNSNQAQALKSVLKVMKYKSMSYTYTVDKKTFNPQRFKMTFTAVPLKKAVGSETIHMEINTSFSKINQLQKLTIPANILKNARTVDPSALQNQ
ncbi:MAG: DUF6612 family protein [Sporolactobacillus sp.]